MNISRAVISSGFLRNCQEQEIIYRFRCCDVIRARQLTEYMYGECILSDSWLLTFNKPSVPQSISPAMLFNNLKVKRYIPTPMQYSRCFRFGHTAKRRRLPNEPTLFR